MAPTAPFSLEAERSVVGAMLARPKLIPEIIATQLQAEHFHSACSMTYDKIVDAFYTDGATDPVSIADKFGSSADGSVLALLKALADAANPAEAISHAQIVKTNYDRRELLDLATDIERNVQEQGLSTAQVAAETAQKAMQIATSRILTNEIVSYEDLGRRFVHRQRELMEARKQGIEIGAFFGLQFLDERMYGLKPTELMILAGEPGVGKSGIAWCAAKAFAERQLTKPVDKRIGTFVLSLEMSEEPSSQRLAQAAGGLDGNKLRDGSVTEDELARVIKQWGAHKDSPLYFNFTSMLRAAQLRALVVEAIRRYGVGLVVIDHMRYFDADRRFDSAADEDEAKARFLKESIAKDLNCAVILLCHTTKGIEATDDRRPRLSHLRGGGMVAAHADFVSFAYSPYMHAKEEDILEGKVARTDMELIWAKNRHGLTATSHLYFDPSTMFVRDAI